MDQKRLKKLSAAPWLWDSRTTADWARTQRLSKDALRHFVRLKLDGVSLLKMSSDKVETIVHDSVTVNAIFALQDAVDELVEQSEISI